MIILKGNKETIRIKCTANVSGDNGVTQPNHFFATWKRREVSESEAIVKALSGNTDIEAVDKAVIDGLVNLEGLRDAEDNQELEFSPDLVAAVLAMREYRVALVDSMYQSLLGKKGVVQKN